MKRPSAILLCLSVSLAAGATAVGGLLLKDDVSAKNVDFPPVRHGINLSGLGTPGEQTPRLEAVDYYRTKGFRSFRIPIQWELIQPKLGQPLDPITIDRVQQVITRAGSDATIILDVHNSGRWHGNLLGNNASPRFDDFEDLWIRLARAFPSPNIVYNLMNEPHDMSDDDVVAMMNHGIAGIRRSGAANLILVSGNSWSNRASFGKGATNWALMSRIVDDRENWAIDYHVYADAWSAGQSAAIDSRFMHQVEEFTVEARARKRRAVVGEWAVAGDTASLAAGRMMRKHFEQNPDVYISWNWWGGGGWWPADYLFLLDPYGSQWDPKNFDRDRRLGGTGNASIWAKPLRDKPQMAILDN